MPHIKKSMAANSAYKDHVEGSPFKTCCNFMHCCPYVSWINFATLFSVRALTCRWKPQLARSDSVFWLTVHLLNTLRTVSLKKLMNAAVSLTRASWLSAPQLKAVKSLPFPYLQKVLHFLYWSTPLVPSARCHIHFA